MHWRFSRSQHSPHDWGVQFVLAHDDVSAIVFLSDRKHRQHAFFIEIFLRDSYGQHAFHALAVGRFVAMPPYIPGEDANLIEVEGQSVFWFRQNGEILRNFLVSGLHLIEHKEGHDALAFGVLCHVERDVEIDHARKHPANAIVGVAHQPPIFYYACRFLVLSFVGNFFGGFFWTFLFCFFRRWSFAFIFFTYFFTGVFVLIFILDLVFRNFNLGSARIFFLCLFVFVFLFFPE